MRANDHYSPKGVVKGFLAILAFALLCKYTQSLAYPVLALFAVFYLVKRDYNGLYFIVLLAISSIIFNAWFMPKPMVFAVTQRGILATLGYLLLPLAFGRRAVATVGPLRAFLVYILYMAFVSIFGWSPLISGLKEILFVSIFLSCYVTTCGVCRAQDGRRQLRTMVLALVCFFVLGSLLVLPVPSIGQMSYDELLQSTRSEISLFKGMTVHSQTLGPVMAICGVLLLGDFVFSIQRADKLYVLLLLAVPFLIVKTSSRTAMGGLLAGVFFVMWCLMRTRNVRRNWKSRIQQWAMLACVAASLAVVCLPFARERVARYVVKYGETDRRVDLSVSNVLSSREAKLENALYYWRKSPVFGNGFQVSEDMQGFEAQSLAQIMTAPVEKSTWVYAILEEGGIVGEVLFCVIALYIVVALMKAKAYVGASCFFTMLVLNLGEFVMFALSGVGGFIWAMVFVGCALDAQRLMADRRLGAGAFLA